MPRSTDSSDLFKSSHLMLLVSFTIFATVLVVETILMGWESWVIIPIAAGILVSWIIHFRQSVPYQASVAIYAGMMMCFFFFYGTHLTSTFDLAVVMSALIVLCTMTGIKKLVTFCQITYYITMAYSICMMIIAGETFDVLVISRTVMHLGMIFMIGWLAKSIIDRWLNVLNESKDEVEQLKDATDRLNDFLANVSHEIRTPVNAIIGLTGICIDKTEDRDVRADMIAVRTAGRKVAEQISDILDYSEIDRKKAVSNNEDYMLSSVLHDLVSEIKEYKSKEVELIIDVDPSIPAVMNTDVSKLKKILKALISNGLKYTHKGGVYVRISAEPHEYGVNLCIEVTDTGIGMSEYEMERVYESFYQADSSRTRMGGGLGLGLAIVSGFVSLLGGFMTIRSKEDVGTTVNVSIPQKVIDPASCMSVSNPDNLVIGAYLNFDKYSNPQVRDYYNSMVLNIVKGLGVKMHRVNNSDNLRLLHESVHMTHLFVAEEEYMSSIELMEELAKDIIVVVVAYDDIVLPATSRVRVMAKPFYCFPVVSVLNSNLTDIVRTEKKMYCRNVRALVVDDEMMNLVVAKSIFNRYGMIVTTAISGQESIDRTREQVFDIIFMDHMMSGMDGVEAMKRIRTDVTGLNSATPVVALTANAMSSAKQMFLNEGFDGFVSKPIEIEELERVMKQVLPKSAVSFETEDGQTKDEEAKDSPNDGPVDIIKLHQTLKEYGVDTDSGMRYCMGDKEFYKTLLVQFATESVEKAEAIRSYYKSGDWHNYEIQVHALKSTAKMIGANELSEMAKGSELAAKEEREDYIIDHHDNLMKLYDKTTKAIRDIYGVKGDDAKDDEVLEFVPGGDME